MTLTRRDSLKGLAAYGAGALLVSGGQEALEGPDAGVGSHGGGSRGKEHAVKALPLNPAKLKGLSEKLIRSHHENNYAGAVKNLNKVQAELANLSKDAPGFLVGGLKERELTYFNSMVLHEHYFGNLGGNGKPGGPMQALLASRHGSFGAWEQLFRQTAASLGGGSGWVMVDFNFHTGEPQTFWSGNHTQTSAFGQPLLVLDMYEHAYQMDFGAAAARYIDAFFQNLNWDEANRRLERAQKAAAVLRS